MRTLFISNLYPSSTDPGVAPFNRQLVGALATHSQVRVVGPVYWFPGQRLLRGRRLPPKRETLHGIEVTHPRVLYTPGILIHHHWLLYRISIARHLRRMLSTYQPDQVIAGFLYPDAAAIMSLCQQWGVPCSVRVNGSDFRVRTQQARFRGIVLETMRKAEKVFCPGMALRRDIITEGIDSGKVAAFDNGVDHSVFHVRPREEALAQLETKPDAANLVARLRQGARCILYVGHMRHIKGADRMPAILQAVCRDAATLGDTLLVMIGQGELMKSLQRRSVAEGLGNNVVFLGGRPHREIALWMNAADCLCLPSRSEGMPNVVLESLASGLPVVATNVGEVPFLVNEDNGQVCNAERSEEALAVAFARRVEHVVEREWDRVAISAAVSHLSWDRAAAAIEEGLCSLA